MTEPRILTDAETRERFGVETLAEVASHANASPQAEVCGFIVAVGRRQTVMPATNYSGDPEIAVPDVETVVAAEEAGEVLAFYHSHIALEGKPPNLQWAHGEPSDMDIRSAERLETTFLIYSVRDQDFRTYVPTGYRIPLRGRVWQEGTADCLTLLEDYFQQEHDIALPNFDRQAIGASEDELHKAAMVSGFVVVHPRFKRAGDVIVMNLPGFRTLHCAIWTEDAEVLHHIEHRLSMKEPYSGLYRDATRTVYRHRSLVREGDAVQDDDSATGGAGEEVR